MTPRIMCLRSARWKLVGALGFLLAFLVPFEACAAEPPRTLNKCSSGGISFVRGDQALHFCVDNGHLWMQEARSFSNMARLCCVDEKQALESLGKGFAEKEHPKKGDWYLLDQSLIIPGLVAQIKGSHQRGLEATPTPEATPTLSPAPTPVQTPAPTPSPTPKPPEKVLLWSIWISGAIVALAVLVFGLSLWTFFKVKAAAKRSSLPAQTVSMGGSKAELEALTALLTESLTQGLRTAIPQRIVVELMPPPASRLTEWEPFLRKLEELLGRSAFPPVTAPRTATGGARPESFPQFQSNSGGVKSDITGTLSRGTAGNRLYVQRATVYGAGAKTFGGDPVFQETPSNRAGFYVEPGEDGGGWLYPNSSAREYDPLHEKLFSLGINDFPLKVIVEPRLVRRDGDLWVLDSQVR